MASHHFAPCHIVSYRIVLYHIVLYRIILYLNILFCIVFVPFDSDLSIFSVLDCQTNQANGRCCLSRKLDKPVHQFRQRENNQQININNDWLQP